MIYNLQKMQAQKLEEMMEDKEKRVKEEEKIWAVTLRE